ncbi:MAG: cupin domain-containing protein [Dehalococcoidales bacterium]|nr:cupin domain-containing protein [Dehalococcoidales bacterium]
MIVSSYSETKPIQELPGIVKREVACADKGAKNFCMRVFDVDPGAATPSHEHQWEHEIYILCGQGTTVSQQGETPIAKDSVIFIPPNEHHCIRNTGNEILRLICVIPIIG